MESIRCRNTNKNLIEEIKNKYLNNDIYLNMMSIAETLTAEELAKTENSIYKIDGHKLTDKERINYELKRLEQKDIEYGGHLNQKIRRLAYLYHIKKIDTKNTKISITIMQLQLDLAPGFYSVFTDVLEILNELYEQYNKKKRLIPR